VNLIFLDRDGVVNEFPGNGYYVTKLKEFHFIPRSLDAIRILTEKGFTIFIVSNQAGVGKGVYSKQKLQHITRKMLEKIKEAGGEIRKVYYCTHRSDHGCDCRKPQIGSIRKGLKLVGKSPGFAKSTYFVGDTESDIQAGHNAGCKTIFVLSGREDCHYMRRWDDIRPDYIFRDLYDATQFVTGSKSIKPISQNSTAARAIINKRRRKININHRRRSADSH